MRRKRNIYSLDPLDLLNNNPYDRYHYTMGNRRFEHEAIKAIMDYIQYRARDFESLLKHNPDFTEKLFQTIDHYERSLDTVIRPHVPENGCNGISDEEYEDALALIEEFSNASELTEEENDDLNDAMDKVKRYEQG
jgi:hypothetical protein